MRRSLKNATILLALTLYGFVGCSVGHAQTTKPLSMGTSSMGSAFYALSVVIGNVVTKQTGINIGVEPVGGSDATVRGLAANKLDLAMMNSNTAYDAYAGTGSYAKTGKIPIALIAQGQDSLRQIVVRRDSGIKTPSDLVGKKFIGKRRALGEFDMITDVLFDLYGIDRKKVKILETTESNEAVDALKVGSVDAAILPAGVGASFLLDLAQKTDIDILQLPDDKLSAMIKRLGPAFHKSKIPANTYRGVTKDVYVPAMSALLVCRTDLPDETVYRITKAIFANYQALKNSHSSGKDWSLENTLKDQPIPFHPGAIRYFKEIGSWKFK